MRNPAYRRRRAAQRARARPGRSRGFVMMFTLIAVAMAGFVMIETAPDFSNYAVLSKSQQFDTALSKLRQVVSSRPFYLTTADGIVSGVANDVLTPDELKLAIGNLVVTSGSVIPSSELTLGTTPVDPYVPAREFDEIFWSASFNFIQDPSFYDLTRREALDPAAMTLIYLADGNDTYGAPFDADGLGSILKTDRFGRDHGSLVPSDSEWHHLSASPDGSRLLVGTDVQKNGSFDVLTFSGTGASYSFANASINAQESLPEWAPAGNLVSFRRRLADNTFRMVVKAPELQAVEQDPISATLLTANPMPVARMLDMGPAVFSPSGRYVAFWVHDTNLGANEASILVYDVTREQFHVPAPTGDGGSTYTGGTCPTCPLAKRHTPLTWMPDSDGFVYVRPNGDIVFARNLGLGAAFYTPLVNAGTSFQNAHHLLWLPLSSPGSGVASSTAFLAITPDGANSEVGSVYRRRITDPPGVDLRLAEDVSTGWETASNSQRSYRPLAISPGGTTVAYIDQTKKKVFLMGADGSRPREHFDIGADAKRPTEFIQEVGFVAPPTAWSYHPTAAKRVTRAALASFDQRGWREFTQSEALFPGDSRFGDGHLRIIPPPFEGQFLFDNGDGIFRVDPRNPAVNVGNVIPQKIEPTWGYRNVNYIARESTDITGGFPSDTFKQAIGGTVGSGTTVLVTTGLAPAYGPDNEALAVSKLMSPHTTFPPDTTAFPPVDMDLWIVEANGSPDPPPRNLTPSTTGTIEGAPAFSPDGRFVYYQRETQQTSKFLGNHSSGIYRVTANGGAVTQIIGEGSIEPAWNEGLYVSALEFYQPAVSPDGTRLAFIAKERLLGLGSLGPNISTTRVGEVIGEGLYVKDLLFSSAPVCLLRTYDAEIGARMNALGAGTYLPRLRNGGVSGTSNLRTGDSSFANHSLWKPSWSNSGEEIFLTRTFPSNRWFPKKDFYRSGSVGNNDDYRHMLERSQIIAVKVTHPRPNPVADSDAIQVLPDGSFDPPADNFRVLVRNVPDGPLGSLGGTAYDVGQGMDMWKDDAGVDQYDPDRAFDWVALGFGDPANGSTFERDRAFQRNILNAVPSRGAFAAQRITKDGPSNRTLGVQLNTDYVLSGYVRTEGGIAGIHSGQIMLQLLNSQGLLVSLQGVETDVYQVGLADIGGSNWTRFSAGVNFDLDPGDPNDLKQAPVGPKGNWGDNPPYSLNVMLYSIGGVGSIAEFTGIKMERAFDTRTFAPTVFNPGWVLHSSSKLPDPRRPDATMFER